MSLGVYTPAARPAGELGVLPRRDLGMGLAVPFHQALYDDGPGRHVDPECKGLRREHRPDQTADEKLLDHLLECRQHSGVVGGQPAFQTVHPLVIAEDVQVLVGDVGAPFLDDGANLVTLLGHGESNPGVQALAHRRVATDPAEHEDDRR